MLIAAACNNSATNPNASGSLPAASPASSASAGASAAVGSPSASARASGSAAASAAGSAGAVSKYVQLQIVSPEDGDRAGIDGKDWMVTVLATGHGPAMDQVQPALNFVNGVGMNQAFPGLVVLIKTTGGSATQTKIDPDQNLAKLFQMIGLPNAGGGPVSVAGTSGGATGGGTTAGTTGASGRTGTSGATTGSASGTTGASSSRSADDRTVNATYYAQNARFGTDVDVEMTVFVVEGNAPDTVSDRSSLRIVSNEVTVRFHIDGSGQASTTGGSASSTPAASPSGAASPTASPSSSP